MISEYKYNKVVKPILDTYAEIEQDLIGNIVNAVTSQDFKSLKKELTKLEKISELDRQNIRTIARRTKSTQKQVKEAFNEIGFETIDLPLYRSAYNKKLIKSNPMTAIKNEKIANIINQSAKETTNYLKLINSKAVTNSKKKYMEILNKTYLETSTGLYDYKTSIKRALTKLADEGISVVQYKRKDGSIMNYSIESAVRRDLLTKVHQLALSSKMEAIIEMGIDYVSVPAHLGARVDLKDPINNHAGWQGKIYKLNGENKQHKNFYEVTGYGTLLGLGGVNCRHYFLPYIKGISKPPEKVSTAKNDKLYYLEQQQRKLERDVRKWKKRLIVDEKTIEDEKEKELQLAFDKKKINEKQKILQSFIKNNDGLKRQYDREYVQQFSNFT